MQIPVGLTVDRLSIRHVLTFMSCITALGCAVFGVAQGLGTAALGRTLIGFSAAFAFISALRLATAWFPPSKLGLLSGLTQSLGMLGAAAGAAPVSLLVAWVGWRYSMGWMAVLFLLLAWLLYRFVHDTPTGVGHAAQPLPSIGIFASLKRVLGHSQTWINALYTGFCLRLVLLLRRLRPCLFAIWPRFIRLCCCFAIGLIFIGWFIGGRFNGLVSDRIGRRKPL